MQQDYEHDNISLYYIITANGLHHSASA